MHDAASLPLVEWRRFRLPVGALRRAGIFTVAATIDCRIGSLHVGELGLLGILLGVAWMRLNSGAWPTPLLASRGFRVLAAGVLVSLAGYLLSDLVRGSALDAVVPVWARVGFVGIDLVALAALVGVQWQNVALIVAGRAVGWIVFFLLNPDVSQQADGWKFGWAIPVTYLLLLAVHRRPPWLAWLGLTALGVVHLFMTYRAAGACCILTGALALVPYATRRWRVALLAASLGLGGAGLGYAYSQLNTGERSSESSNLSRAAQLEVGWEYFWKSPLVGYGSRYDRSHLMSEFYARRAQLLGPEWYEQADERETSLHSQILTALTEGGLLGGVFFLLYGWTLVRATGFAAVAEFPLRLPVLYLMIFAAFDLLMSPFSGPARFDIALAAAVALALLAARRG